MKLVDIAPGILGRVRPESPIVQPDAGLFGFSLHRQDRLLRAKAAPEVTGKAAWSHLHAHLHTHTAPTTTSNQKRHHQRQLKPAISCWTLQGGGPHRMPIFQRAIGLGHGLRSRSKKKKKEKRRRVA